MYDCGHPVCFFSLSLCLFLNDFVYFLIPLWYREASRPLNQFLDLFLMHCHSRSYSSFPAFLSFAVNPSVFDVYHFLSPPLPFSRRLSWINAALAVVTFQLRSCLPLCDPLPSLCLSTSMSRINAGFSHCHIVAQVVFY